MNSTRPTRAPSAAVRCPSRRHHLLHLGAAAAAALLALSLPGCGGAESDDAPTATLVSTVTSASAGESITLIASASADPGVSAVQLYRADSASNTLLGTLNATPYQFSTAIPDDATGTVSYFARAIDNDGNTGDSAVLNITVTD